MASIIRCVRLLFVSADHGRSSQQQRPYRLTCLLVWKKNMKAVVMAPHETKHNVSFIWLAYEAWALFSARVFFHLWQYLFCCSVASFCCPFRTLLWIVRCTYLQYVCILWWVCAGDMYFITVLVAVLPWGLLVYSPPPLLKWWTNIAFSPPFLMQFLSLFIFVFCHPLTIPSS